MCFKEVIPQLTKEQEKVEKLEKIKKWKVFACEINTIDIIQCTDAIARNGFEQVIDIITN